MWRVIGVLCLVSANAFAQPSAAPQSTLVAPPSHGRPDHVFVGLGVMFGFGGPSDWLYGAYHAELGITALHLDDDLSVRARAFGTLYGGTVESDWGGDFARYGVGLEGRYCGDRTCVFVDVDAGYQKLTLDDNGGDFVRSDKGLVGGPRFGFDWGGAVRLRFALELYGMLSDHKSAIGTNDGFDAFGTINLSLGLGVQL